MDEPTIEFLDKGRLLMVLRGSNDRHPELPGYRWFSVSHDGGNRWTVPQPWTYHDGGKFFSPSACSQLLRHSSGRLFWLGNITSENPRGNRPRYPFVIGEVDRVTGLLRRESVRPIDTLQPGEDPILPEQRHVNGGQERARARLLRRSGQDDAARVGEAVERRRDTRPFDRGSRAPVDMAADRGCVRSELVGEAHRPSR
jgi:hypothetical protein